MIAYPSTPTPAGCLLGFFGLLAWAFSGICFYGIFKAFNLEDQERSASVIRTLGLLGGVGVIIGLLLFFFGWKLVKEAH